MDRKTVTTAAATVAVFFAGFAGVAHQAGAISMADLTDGSYISFLHFGSQSPGAPAPETTPLTWEQGVQAALAATVPIEVHEDPLLQFPAHADGEAPISTNQMASLN